MGLDVALVHRRRVVAPLDDERGVGEAGLGSPFPISITDARFDGAAASSGGPEVMGPSSIKGALSASAASRDSTAGRGSYSTSMRAKAARAWARLCAATAATAWPW